MTQRVENAINIFLDALNKGDLSRGSFCQCAVGNLISAGMKEQGCYDNQLNGAWSSLFYTSEGKQIGHLTVPTNHTPELVQDGMKSISYTNFTYKELMAIEFAFETNTNIDGELYYKYPKEAVRADQIKGLEAVVKVMLEFEDSKEDVKEVFTNKAELIPI